MILRLATSATHDIGATPQARSRFFRSPAARSKARRLRGQALAGGGDCVTAHEDGTVTLDLRVTLETDDGERIHMTFTGVRDDSNHYFRTVPRFETAAPKYALLNRLLAVGIGDIRPDGPVHIIEEVL
jgi:uncharacterized protein DUF3237